VIYGMSAERLTVWLEPFDTALAARVGVLCRRHADAMVVPNRWSLDDRRPPAQVDAIDVSVEVVIELNPAAEVDSPAQLFTSPSPVARDKPAKRRKRRQLSSDDTGQLELLALPPDEPPAEPHAEQPGPAAAVAPAEPPVAPWKPVFDQASDLEGLLDVRSPLLSRAFRGRSPKP